MRLVITEKHSVAKSIAKVIGATENKDGYCEGNGYLVTWCIGHLVELCNPDEYNEQYKVWQLETLPILPDNWKYKISSKTSKQFNVIKKLIERKDVVDLIEATDAGREGELIFRLVYSMTKTTKPFYRLWISSMEDKSIREGFNNLKFGSEYDNLYQSAKCRQQADWLVGMNGTRLFTVLYGNGNVLPIGRVQTPTLQLICKRDDEIRNFKSEAYYQTHIITENGINAVSENLDKSTANLIAAKCQNERATVLNFETKEKQILPPKLYDLTALQKEANEILGYTAQQTLTYLQELYENKIVTYPRTDSNYLTSDMKDTAVKLISVIIDKYTISHCDKNINISNVNNIINNDKVTDHHAIIPTMEIAEIDFDNLLDTHKKLLYLIIFRLLEATSTNYIYENTIMFLECLKYNFKATGQTINSLGWTKLKKEMLSILGKDAKVKDNTILPSVNIGSTIFVVDTNCKELWTKPKPHYTEATILSAMEKAGVNEINKDVERKGLGTPATRASIIEKLLKDGLITRDKSHLMATEKGLNLMKIVPAIIKSPSMTAEWENQLSNIAIGKENPNNFMRNIMNIVKVWVSENRTVKEEYKSIFTPSQQQSKEIVCLCPKCGGNVYENSKAFSCENRDFSLFKNNKFFSYFGKSIDRNTAAALLKNGSCYISDFYSKKNGTKFGATVKMQIGEKYPEFSLEFENKKH